MTIELHSQPGTELADRKDYADSISYADILPPAFARKPANCLVAMEVADALQMRPFMVMQEMAIIGGRPSFSAKFMRALVRRAGHRLRESFEDGVARCVIIRHDDPEHEHVATWDETKARQHDYWGKGHWKKNPELMLKNRAISECVREACPEVLGGVAYTPDEIADFAPEHPSAPAPQRPSKPVGGVAAARDAIAQQTPTSPASATPPPTITEVDECDDLDALRAMWQRSAGDVRQLIEAKVHDLKHVDTETGEVHEGEIIEDGGDS